VKFHLNYRPATVQEKISHQHSLFLVGSCFSENIGCFFSEKKYKVLVNPDGILFNPISILNCLEGKILEQKNPKQFFIQRGQQYVSYLHHSSINAPEQESLIEILKDKAESSLNYLKTTDFLIITFGTAYAYLHKQLHTIVANCHKQDANLFEKKLLELDEIVLLYQNFISNVRKQNPTLRIIFTVSPVKHLRDGVEENSISKAILLLSVRKIIEKNKNCYYFPAFELVNDDLRDYRFYKEDLAHPNDLAINYVWEKFSETYFSTQTIELNKLIHKLNLAQNHEKMSQNFEENQKLNKHIEGLRSDIHKINPDVSF